MCILFVRLSLAFFTPVHLMFIQRFATCLRTWKPVLVFYLPNFQNNNPNARYTSLISSSVWASASFIISACRYPRHSTLAYLASQACAQRELQFQSRRGGVQARTQRRTTKENRSVFSSASIPCTCITSCIWKEQQYSTWGSIFFASGGRCMLVSDGLCAQGTYAHCIHVLCANKLQDHNHILSGRAMQWEPYHLTRPWAWITFQSQGSCICWAYGIPPTRRICDRWDRLTPNCIHVRLHTPSSQRFLFCAVCRRNIYWRNLSNFGTKENLSKSLCFSATFCRWWLVRYFWDSCYGVLFARPQFVLALVSSINLEVLPDRKSLKQNKNPNFWY